MSGFPILDLVAGLIFIYFLLSIICSSAVEIALTASKVRAKMLAEWLTTIFNDPVPVPATPKTLGQAIMDHCAITALSKSGKSNSYMDAKNFSSALLEKVLDSTTPLTTPVTLPNYITALQTTKILPPELQRVFLTYAYDAQANVLATTVKTISDIELFKNKIEAWYDTSMDRVSGALKPRYSRPFTSIAATLIVFVINTDSISIARYLYDNPDARVKLSEQAYAASKNKDFQQQVNRLSNVKGLKGEDSIAVKHVSDSINARLADIAKAQAALTTVIPIGWTKADWKEITCPNWLWLLTKLGGLVATILAMMMGAPFWFDVLNKISNLRGSGKKPDVSGGKGQGS